MELVQHEVVHSRQASVLTLKCIGFKRWSVNSIPLWLWWVKPCATKMSTTYVHIEVNSWTSGSWSSPEMVLDFYSGVYVTYLFRDLQHHPTSMGWGSRSLRWLIPFSWSLHRIGCPDIRTQICCGRATAFFPSVDDIDMLVNQWLPFTCSHSYLAIEAYSSRCGLARNVHPLLYPSIPFQDASWNSTTF